MDYTNVQCKACGTERIIQFYARLGRGNRDYEVELKGESDE